LEQAIPGQPTIEKINNNPLLSRFTLVFDREGYSPVLMLHLKKKHIACMTLNRPDLARHSVSSTNSSFHIP